MASQPQLGAGHTPRQSAEAIHSLRNPEPQAPTEDAEVIQPANGEDTQPERPRGPDGKFLAEPQDEVEEAEVEEAELPDDTEPSEPSEEADEDQLELADNVEGLAEQLGIDLDTLLDHLTDTVKVNGEEKRVTLRDLKSGYQMEQDYRLKTADAAEQRRKADELSRLAEADRNHYAQSLQEIVERAVPILKAEESRLMAMLDENSPEYDPVAYQRERIKFDQQKEELQRVEAERQATLQRQQEEEQRRQADDIAENARLLTESVPEWGKDTAKAADDIKAIRNYAVGQGMPRDLVEQEYRAPMLLMARKAMQWDEFQEKKKSVRKVVAKAPKVLKPGTGKRPAKPADKVTVHKRNMQRFFKNPTRQNSVAAIKSFRAARGG